MKDKVCWTQITHVHLEFSISFAPLYLVILSKLPLLDWFQMKCGSQAAAALTSGVTPLALTPATLSHLRVFDPYTVLSGLPVLSCLKLPKLESVSILSLVIDPLWMQLNRAYS